MSSFYDIGVSLALENTGLAKEASLIGGTKQMFGGVRESLADFFKAKRLREALHNLSEVGETGTAKLTQKGQLRFGGAVEEMAGKTPIQRGRLDVLDALKPYGAVAGLGSLAAATPSILGTIYPDYGD